MVKGRHDMSTWGRKRPTPSTTVKVDDVVSLPVCADVAWARVLDVKAVASCLPGLVPDTLRLLDDGQYQARVQALAIGVTATWEMTARLAPDEASRRLAITLEGDDHRLGLRLDGTADLQVQPNGTINSQLAYAGTVTVQGRLAAAGGPIISAVVANMVQRFVHSLSGATVPQPRRLRRVGLILARVPRWFRRRGAGHDLTGRRSRGPALDSNPLPQVDGHLQERFRPRLRRWPLARECRSQDRT